MHIQVTRTDYTTTSTISTLSIDGKNYGYILEDVVRPKKAVKVWGRTAIDAGTYKIVPHNSPHFKMTLPMLVNVPNYQYVLIHWGNSSDDTEGCLITGTTKSKNFVGNSKAAFNKIYPLIVAAWNKSIDITLPITDTKSMVA
jgi:hypothetical protein